MFVVGIGFSFHISLCLSSPREYYTLFQRRRDVAAFLSGAATENQNEFPAKAVFSELEEVPVL
jgi:hypothetical protein